MPGMEDATVLTMLDYMEWRNREGNVLLRPRAVKEGGSEAPNQYLHALDRIIKDYAKRDVCAEAYLAKARYYRNIRVMKPSTFIPTINGYLHCVS